MRQKLHSKKGFTLSEVLMTVLILTLVTSVIAGGIGVVRNAYQRVVVKAEAQTLCSTALSAVMNELRYAEEISVDTQNPNDEDARLASFDSPLQGYRIYYYNDAEGDSTRGIMVGNNLGNDSSLPLLTGKTMTNGLIPVITYSYDVDQKQFTVKIEVQDKSRTIKATSGEVIIHPINES